MVENKKTPKIRFAGFTDDWEQRKLLEVLIRRQIYQQISDDTPRLAFAAGQGVIPLSERKTNNRDQLIADEATKRYLLTEYNDIVYNPANLKYGAIDRNKYGRGVISPIYVTFTTEEVSSFIERIVVTEKFKIKALQFEEGTVVKRQMVNPENLLSFEEWISPNKEEQQQIGDFFDNLDNLITLHQRKHNKLVVMKESMLEKMFPINGSSVPEIRFAGFTDAWEQCKLGSIVDIRSGKDYKHLSEGDIPVYGTGGYMLSVNEALSYKEDAIGIGRKGTIDKPYILRAPFWTVDTLFYAVPETNNDLDFSYDIFQNINWKQKDESTGVPSLSKTAINDIDVLIPKYTEQKIIGTFFQNFDNLITLHQRKLEKLKKIKKSMLEKMFV